MVKTAEQRAKRREKRKAKKRKQAPPKKHNQPKAGGATKKKRNRKRKDARGGGGNGYGTVPRVMSAVNDGINTGMVWKNTSSIEDFFKPRFEKVSDLVTTGTAFAIIKQFFLNPGNSTLFPVFSQIAAVYEQYRCHLLRFWYRGEEYTASGTNVSAGILVYATNFDVDDNAFTGVDQMENYENSISGPPFAGHFAHDVLVGHRKRGRNRSVGKNDLPLNDYFVLSSANSEAPTGLAAAGKFYDMGNFQIASNGTQASTPAGELWVEHSWTMIRRKQSTPLGQQLLTAHWVENPAASAAAAGSAFLGTAASPVLRTGSNWPGTATSSTFTLPVPGVFLVSALWVGSVTVQATYALGSNITGLQIMVDNADSQASAVGGGNSATLMTVTVSTAGTGAANTVTISGLTNLAAGKADLFIAQLAGGVTLTKKSATELLELRMADLERRLLTTVREEPDSDFEEKSVSSSSSLSLDRSVHLSRDAVRTLLAAAK